MPHNNGITSIAIDASGIKWIGTGVPPDLMFPSAGLVEFDGTNWTVYNPSNSGLKTSNIWAITIDSFGNKWIGTDNGLYKFDGINWTAYNVANLCLPNYIYYISSIVIDGSGNKWIGTCGGGLVKFDGINWTVYNAANSGLPNNYIYSIAIDSLGNKWIGMDHGGIAIYKKGGVTSVKETANKNTPEAFALFQNYPNPFNPSTNISFNLPEKSYVSIKVFDLLGREVATLAAQTMSAGTHALQWNAGKMPSGVYFYRLKAGTFTQTKKLVLLK